MAEVPATSEVSGCAAEDISGDVGHRLHPDGVGDMAADSQPRVADLTDDIGVSAQQLDSLLLAETEFPEAQIDVGRARQLFDANSHPHANLAQLQ